MQTAFAVLVQNAVHLKELPITSGVAHEFLIFFMPKGGIPTMLKKLAKVFCR